MSNSVVNFILIIRRPWSTITKRTFIQFVIKVAKKKLEAASNRWSESGLKALKEQWRAQWNFVHTHTHTHRLPDYFTWRARTIWENRQEVQRNWSQNLKFLLRQLFVPHRFASCGTQTGFASIYRILKLTSLSKRLQAIRLVVASLLGGT